ncbi:hypothetical protein THAOC_21718, partial [Thalassiosira oceanica]
HDRVGEGGVSGYLEGIHKIQGGGVSDVESQPAATGASASHFAPFEDVSSLGSVHEDELIDAGHRSASGVARNRSKQQLRDDALMRENGHSSATLKVLNTAGERGHSGVHHGEARGASRSASSGLSDLFHPTFHEAMPVRPSSAASPARPYPEGSQQQARGTLLPMGVATRIDSTLAHVRPPSAPGGTVSPYAAQGVSPKKFVRSNKIGDFFGGKAGGGGGGRGSKGGGAEFSPIPKGGKDLTLTRTSSNASSSSNRIRLGICAMDKKARSKPMAAILERLDAETFEPVYFGDKLILNEPVESWPVCDVLIAFYSNGYPLGKAEEYVSLRQPYLLNDLKMQRTLMDRRRVYDLLEECGIDVPKHVFMSRDGYVSSGTGDGKAIDGSDICCTETNECDDNKKNKGKNKNGKGGKRHIRQPAAADVEIDEHDDHIEVNGVVIQKPFVEKPVDADDHNIAIYYPSSAGGGCKKLFRKVGDRSSEFYPDINEIRRDGSYIYEEFIETQGTDVKMYTVGPDYGHAEARKSPTVDGKVERNAEGKEVRFPVILTLREKEIARRIVLRFKQQVCGFDILRIQEGDSLVSYVCDVNGWSFVKTSRKYSNDCAQILTEHMLAALKPKSQISFSALAPLLATVKDTPQLSKKKKKKKKKGHHRVQSVADRIRTALVGIGEESTSDRPESNAKGDGPHAQLGLLPSADEFEEHVDFKGHARVRDLPDQLATSFTDPATMNGSKVPSENSSLADADDLSLASKDGAPTHQEELRCVITIIRHGDRTPKQKLKGEREAQRYLDYFHNHTKKIKKDLKVKAKKEMVEFLETVKADIHDMEAEDTRKNKERLYKARHMRDILMRWKISGLNRKLQMKPRSWTESTTDDGDTVTRCSKLQLIVKWGGDLTKLGESQAIRLGNRLRDELYPSNEGGGILRLHSTFRHDLKIKTSDEGRVMKTAAAFAKGMLELEGDVRPILVSLVHKEKDSHHMLDPSGNKEVKKDLDRCKEQINVNMQKDVEYSEMTREEREQLVGPERLTSLHRALKEIGNPRRTLKAIHGTIGNLVEQLDEMLGELLSGDEEVIEGGAGLKGDKEEDAALSGIKLYKGETLLELTERWKLLQARLYDEETDVFDLSRVPDVHDNVRFDMLHNPHLGLAETLQRLYDLAKSMADCVVPQEYGITIEEKRDIGAKMCNTLLDKINYDLTIARTDNQVDMRYLINMDYSADLPINSMGRRVRSRLYFTSESHLHSLLNVLRFPSIVPSPLSWQGQQILQDASELCYLTQVVIRLFEDTQKPNDDPKRFRVEILFSPGATAAPTHMNHLQREKDEKRFDTEKLQKISIDGLTCAQVEEYFEEAIKEGRTEDDDDGETTHTSKTVKIKTVKNKSESGQEGGSRDGIATVEKAAKRLEKIAELEHSNIDGAGWRRRSVLLAGAVLAGAGCLFLLSRTARGRR